MVSAFAALSGLLTLLTTFQSVAATARGLAWATDNRYAPTIATKPKISWYHHWQDGPVSQMPKDVEYVPMFWGPSKWGLWNQRQSQMKNNPPKYLLTFNEPDVSSQANMNPYYAAQLWMEQIHPWSKKGVKIGSPAIAWDLNWLDTFTKELNKRGGHYDFVCVHWYGSYKDLSKFKKFIKAAHDRFGKKIWIPEFGITHASNPSPQDIQNFISGAHSYMDSSGFVDRSAWFGCFLEYQPPDNYATGRNALFSAPYKLSNLGHWYGSSSSQSTRRSINIRNRHHDIAARENATTADEDDGATHCDEICQLREEAIADWYAQHPDADTDDA